MPRVEQNIELGDNEQIVHVSDNGDHRICEVLDVTSGQTRLVHAPREATRPYIIPRPTSPSDVFAVGIDTANEDEDDVYGDDEDEDDDTDTSEEASTDRCDECNAPYNVFSGDYYRTVDGVIVCRGCMDAHYSMCAHCCNAFDARETNPNETNSMCRRCYENAPLRTRRENLTDTEFQSSDEGRIIKSQRRFGVEIELLNPSREMAGKMCRDLPKSFGVGTDSSIRGRGLGLEVRTPILKGKAGEKIIREATKTLRKYAYVNASCGLHVHLENTGWQWYDVKNIFTFYLIFEEVIMAMLPRTRRKSRYAKSIKSGYSVEEIMTIGSRSDLERRWYQNDDSGHIDQQKGSHYTPTRYYGINLHALLNHDGKTIEVRYHSPTLSPLKILNWINLHQTILDRAPNIHANQFKEANGLLFFEDKLEAFCKLLRLDEKAQKYIKGRIALFNPKHKKLCAV